MKYLNIEFLPKISVQNNIPKSIYWSHPKSLNINNQPTKLNPQKTHLFNLNIHNSNLQTHQPPKPPNKYFQQFFKKTYPNPQKNLKLPPDPRSGPLRAPIGKGPPWGRLGAATTLPSPRQPDGPPPPGAPAPPPPGPCPRLGPPRNLSFASSPAYLRGMSYFPKWKSGEHMWVISWKNYRVLCVCVVDAGFLYIFFVDGGRMIWLNGRVFMAFGVFNVIFFICVVIV